MPLNVLPGKIKWAIDVVLASASRPGCLYDELKNIYDVISLPPKSFIFNVSLMLFPLFSSEKFGYI